MPRMIIGPTVVQAAGNKPKRIEEYAGRVNRIGEPLGDCSGPVGRCLNATLSPAERGRAKGWIGLPSKY